MEKKILKMEVLSMKKFMPHITRGLIGFVAYFIVSAFISGILNTETTLLARICYGLTVAVLYPFVVWLIDKKLGEQAVKRDIT